MKIPAIVDLHTMPAGVVHHPLQRNIGETGICKTTADIAMNAAESFLPGFMAANICRGKSKPVFVKCNGVVGVLDVPGQRKIDTRINTVPCETK